jgi:hypothetical protein
MEIRKDFVSVTEHLERLILYGDAFEENDFKDWLHLKNKEDYRMIYSLEDEAIRVLEKIYMDGRDVAGFMSSALKSFNYADRHPTLTSFVHSFDGGWVYQIDKLKKTTNEVKEKCKELGGCPWAIDQMIILFEEQLKLLEATHQTLQLLKQTDLFKTENNKALSSWVSWEFLGFNFKVQPRTKILIVILIILAIVWWNMQEISDRLIPLLKTITIPQTG